MADDDVHTPERQEAIHAAAHDARDTGSHRLLYIFAAILIVAILALFAQNYIRGQNEKSLAAQQATAADAAQQLEAQVRRAGLTPVTEAPAAVQAIAGPAGQNGASGSPGSPGSPGAAGSAGATGPKGDPGSTGPSGSPGPTGAAGTAGKDGAAGSDGTNGQDGSGGAAGAQGPPGPQGSPGADGQPPYSWTTTYPDGSTQTCSRGPDFDPSDPTYTCTVESTTTTTDNPPVLGG